MTWLPLLLLLLSFFHQGNTFWEGAIDSILNYLKIETCNSNFISPNFTKLEFDLRNHLFGQNIVIERLIPILKYHFEKSPSKALVICMHGWTGSGKNYATNLIINNIYKNNQRSKFVQFYSGRLHFPIDQVDHVNKYVLDIQNWIKGNVSQCDRSLFVFDEVDKIPRGVIESIKPFLDHHFNIDSVDYRKSIFIFISNIGGGFINKRFSDLWREGKLRTEMRYKDFEPYLRQALYNTKGGFEKSSILESHLVSLYLPFLPLEEEQVRLCIKAEMKRQKIFSTTDKDTEELLNEVEFNEDRFSTSGCKRIADLVAGFRYKAFDEL